MKIRLYVLVNKYEFAFRESTHSHKDILILKLLGVYNVITRDYILTKREYGKFCKIRKIIG